MLNIHRRFALISCVALLTAAIGERDSATAQAPKDIVFYGNSFTNATCCGSTRSVPDVFKDIAVSAGELAPRNRNVSANGQSLLWHLNNNTSIITAGLPAAENWEHVVLQDFSTMPTHIGNLSQHLSSSLGLYQAVAARSPEVVPIMFETWARGPGHSLYTGANPSFPGGPAQMQQVLRDGYLLSTENINMTAGRDVARYAPVGDAWENAGFLLNLYASDIYHAGNRGTLLNALVLYGTIYEDPTTSDIDLQGALRAWDSPRQDGAFLTSIADATLIPEPGTPDTGGNCRARRLSRPPDTFCICLLNFAGHCGQ